MKSLLLVLTTFLLFSCTPEVPETTNGRTSSSSSLNNFWNWDSNNNYTDTNDDGVNETYIYKDPFNNSNNFFFDSNQQNFFIDLESDFDDSFMLRGNEVSEYLYNNEEDVNGLCLVAHFGNSSDKKVVIFSAKSKNTYNYSTGIKEYYLNVQGDSNIGIVDCADANLISRITNDFQVGQDKITYSMSELCPSCQTRFSDSSLKLYTKSGSAVNSVNMIYLDVYFSPTTSVVNNDPLSCTTTTQCKAIGYNCCISGQCATNGALKPGATSDPAYYVAYAATLANPEAYSDYPEIYYVCPSAVTSDPSAPTGSTTTSPEVEAKIRINKLEELYSCINTDKDEMSICSIRYENASQFIDLSDPEDPAGYAFEAAPDDLNFAFTGIMDGVSNIVEVSYGGELLYKEGVVEADETKIILDEETINDDLETPMAVTVKTPLPNSALEDTVIIKYRIDGSCEKLNSFLARCKKYYKQAQASEFPRPSDHEDGETFFALPAYASLDYSLTVSVNGVNVAEGENTWAIGDQGIDFVQPIYPNQEVVITYFVTDEFVDLVTASKVAARTVVNNHCNCGTQNCNLSPVYEEVNGQQEIRSFNCVYPQTQQIDPPLQQVAYVSSKSVPLRFHDEFGIAYDDNYNEAGNHEGVPFYYVNGNTLLPNNLQSYVGFNEIYGSFDRKSNSARPPQMLNVKKGRTYDLYTDQGQFSTCTTCGNDYYSSLQKIFPSSFVHKGGGYQPNWVETRRSENTGEYRADDLIFGRACFVPATMIPFTHVPKEDLGLQRYGRLSAQHFLFANGYSRDWYGFDYGSLIGSFDGVKWFSVGNQRRIKAESNKLFLAVNGYFGDLTNNADFKVIVSELTVSNGATNLIDHDLESDGAECQLYHLCESDNDCIKNLGYDYTCESVSGMTTAWPEFDVNANEIPGGGSYRILSSLVGGVNGKPKRCVYRGRGSLCLADPYDTSSSPLQSLSPALHKCSPNSYCQTLDGEAFNNKVSRFAKSPAYQNNSSTLAEYVETPSDTLGLAARILGRPFNFFGNEPADENAAAILAENGIEAICVPGKSPVEADLASANATAPEEPFADRILGIGVTVPDETSPQMYSACPVVDENGNFVGKAENLSMDDELLAGMAASQNISSSVLLHEDLASLTIFNDDADYITAKGLNKYTCLRAPGASCFTDMDCAPNKFIADQVNRINGDPINEAEANFWREGLICGQDKSKYIPLSTNKNPDYKLSDNKCCREIGNTITVYTADTEEPTFYSNKIAGQDDDTSLIDPMRYSRIHTVIDKMRLDPGNYPPMSAPKGNPSEPQNINDVLRQYNTFHTAASRTCCSGHWVREFSESNGDNHRWVEGKNQVIPKSTFKCINWEPNSDDPDYRNTPYSCDRETWNTAICEIKSLTANEQDFYLSWLEKFELTGIPQIPIETNEQVYCKSEYIDQTDVQGDKVPLKGTIIPDSGKEFIDEDSSIEYFSAGDMSNFKTADKEDEENQGEIKQIFSPNKVSCCLPSGEQHDSSTTDEMCCTGKVFQNRCCLEDYTDVSVYLNRYVSSEAAHLSDSAIDPATGYIKDPGTVMQIAQQKNLCCSGKLSYGHAIHKLMIPGAETESDAKTWRFVSSNGTTDNNNETGNIAEIYDKGVTWNNHVYCVPSSFEDPPTD